jgi:hypothetical protein
MTFSWQAVIKTLVARVDNRKADHEGIVSITAVRDSCLVENDRPKKFFSSLR